MQPQILGELPQKSEPARLGEARLGEARFGSISSPGRFASCFAMMLLAAMPLSAGCWMPAEKEVVAYASLDREFSEPILARFEAETGIAVRSRYDVESNKTVGLANAILRERDRPRCDLFWNNEILHTLRLEKAGLLESYVPPGASELPEAFRSPQGNWHAFAARARVFLIHPQRLKELGLPQPASVRDLADPRYARHAGMARPLFGTTATHAAVWFATWGEPKAQEFLLAVKQNARIVSGNKQVARQVASGELAFGLTDTDDAIIEIEQGMPVQIVFPDQHEAGGGTLLIPNTIAIVKGAPHAEHARRLADFLLTPETESALAAAESGQIPLLRNGTAKSRVVPEKPVRWMEVDYAAAADAWEQASPWLEEQFSLSGDSP